MATEQDTPDAARERRALVVSVVASAALGLLAVGWGVSSGSDVLVFDGIYTLAGIGLAGLSLLASHVATAPPSARFPFGRSAATPVTVVIQGAALGATLLYGVVEAIGSILAGGSLASPGVLIAYGSFSAVASWAVAWAVTRTAPGSDLARAEVVAWRAGAVLSLVVGVGGAVALVLEASGRGTAAGYVDPVLVLVAVALVSPLPARLIRDGLHELLEGAPPPEVTTRIDEAVEEVRGAFGLPPAVVRATKLGRRLYVEMDVVVEPGSWDVDGEDRVRRAVTARLETLPFDVRASVELTTDAGLT